MAQSISYSVFTKPWKSQSIDEVGEFVASLGFDGIELPVRPGYQIEPETVDQLPAAAKMLAKHGVKILSVAGPTDEATIAACARAGVPVIRVMARLEQGETYLEGEERLWREYDALVPLLERYGVTVGVQNHYNRFIANAVAMRRLLERYNPQQIAVVWDAAHEALQGANMDLALDAIWDRLCMVNLKNAIWQRTSGPEAEYAQWKVYWTSGRQGLAVWPEVVRELVKRGYEGTLCLPAEYSDEEAVERLIAEDMAFAKGLFRGPSL